LGAFKLHLVQVGMDYFGLIYLFVIFVNKLAICWCPILFILINNCDFDYLNPLIQFFLCGISIEMKIAKNKL